MPLSYGRGHPSFWKRHLIRACERMAGVDEIERRYARRQEYFDSGCDVWSTAVALLELSVAVEGFPLEQVPRDAPLVVVANHPFGLVDGIVAGSVLSHVRTDFRVIAFDVVNQIDEIRPWIIPITFSGTRAGQRENLKSRSEALRLLQSGGAIVIFPVGEVATADRILGPAIENEWHPFVARLVQSSGATILPLYFHGQNSWMFHLASRISTSLRLAMLMRETRRLIGSRIKVTVRPPLDGRQLQHSTDRRTLAQFLRSVTLQGESGGSNERIREDANSPSSSRDPELFHERDSEWMQSSTT